MTGLLTENPPENGCGQRQVKAGHPLQQVDFSFQTVKFIPPGGDSRRGVAGSRLICGGVHFKIFIYSLSAPFLPRGRIA